MWVHGPILCIYFKKKRNPAVQLYKKLCDATDASLSCVRICLVCTRVSITMMHSDAKSFDEWSFLLVLHKYVIEIVLSELCKVSSELL